MTAAAFELSALHDMTAEEIAASPHITDDMLREFNEISRWETEYPKECQSDLLKLTRYNMPDPEHAHNVEYSRYFTTSAHSLLAEALESVLQGKCLRLIISVQPQLGKSTLAKNFLASHVGRFPYKNLIAAMYNQTFAEEYGDDVRAIIQGEPYRRVFPSVGFRMGSKAKDHMVTTEGGKLSFLGRKGSGTGRPADGFLVDDLFKNGIEAASKATRDEAWNFYTQVANTRCHALTWQVIIGTRWSDDDVIARLTDPKNPHYNADVAKQWTVINLPAIVDDEELARALGIKVGEPLWPERFPLSLLETARKMDPVGFSALHMGKPTPPEGSYYKAWMLKPYDSPAQFPKRARMYLTGDLAVSPEIHADKTCLGLWGLDENDELWLHPELYWARKSSDESVEKLIELGSRFNVMDSWFEKGQLDRAIGPFLDKRHAELVALGAAKSVDGLDYRPQYFSLSKLSSSMNKGLRSTSFRGRASLGKVHFPSFAPWWSAAKEQMLKFTGSGDDKEDDFCDMCGLIGQALPLQVKADGSETNVLKFPKVGTLAWTKMAHSREQEAVKARAALRGM